MSSWDFDGRGFHGFEKDLKEKRKKKRLTASFEAH